MFLHVTVKRGFAYIAKRIDRHIIRGKADLLAMEDFCQLAGRQTVDKYYESNVLFSFFDGLIPEGWLLEMVTRNWKINYKDRFGLLLIACRDCIGDVVVEEADHGIVENEN